VITDKTKSTVLTTSGVVGTSGKAGYLHAITNNSPTAVGTVAIYDGTDTTGTLKWSITVSATAGDSKSLSGLNIYCASGIYAALTNTVLASFEYSGCT